MHELHPSFMFQWSGRTCSALYFQICNRRTGNGSQKSEVCCIVLQCVAVCCSVSQCIAVCCGVLQYVAVCCQHVKNPKSQQYVAVYCNVQSSQTYHAQALQRVAMCCSVLQCVAVCCSVLQYVAVCCSVLQYLVVAYAPRSSSIFANRCTGEKDLKSQL